MTHLKENKTQGISRRNFVLGAGAILAAPVILRGNAWAAGKTLYVSTYEGVQGEVIANQVIPQFEKDYRCKVFQSQTTTLPTIARLRSEKNHPKLSVAMMDDVAIPIARREGLIAQFPTDSVTNLAKVFKQYVYEEGYGAAFSISRIVPWYNTQAIGSEKPTSWQDLWDEKFRKRFIMVTPKWTNSLAILTMAASQVSGKPPLQAQYDIDNAWGRMAELVPNIFSIHENPGSAILQVVQGQADIGGPDHSKSVLPYIVKGAPLEMMDPQEGAFAGVNAITLVNNAPEPELAAAFINRILSPEVQKLMADATLTAPVLPGITLSEEVAKLVKTDEESLAKMINLDWSFINPKRSAIIDKFNQTFL
ncbi:putative spermidine/putrescine transport system substrate-binding protein [Erwinia toletana]|uniref:Spermidine/putrescine transport system substrate-binding protein n=1 Tax=Winslowiella toletana TaxID=92490 RepID=A0ABS4P2C3_9GAMM|nr:extracellular solute-binding protein [Winslowiella toletana]MBP2166820.1 putative spermidine/putrescine transport system substrate-binding protein [Winslowiella toletana]